MADGKMKCVPKKEIMVCFFFVFFKLFFILVEKDGITLGGMLLDG